MKVKSVSICELPPEVGPPGVRLVVIFENGLFNSILIENARDPHEFADRLRSLADDVAESGSTFEGKAN